MDVLLGISASNLVNIYYCRCKNITPKAIKSIKSFLKYYTDKTY